MEIREVRNFVEKFFTLRDCNIIHSDQEEITVVINPDTDKDLEYRPFYWTYIENLKMQPQLLTKRYIFNQAIPQKDFSDEYIFFGSRRLHQIFNATKKRGKYVRLYEDVHNAERAKSLVPWLLVNYKVEYVRDTKREVIYSLGFNLVTGQIIDQCYDRLKTRRLTPKLPNYFFTPTPLFSISTGLSQMEEHITQILMSEDDSWAREALQKYEIERELVEAYFNELEHLRKKKKMPEDEVGQCTLHDERERRLKELEWQYKPRINVLPINFALIFLQNHP